MDPGHGRKRTRDVEMKVESEFKIKVNKTPALGERK